MKKVACLWLALLLCGCQVNEADLKSELTNEFHELSDQAPISYTTMNKPLYSYYLPKDVGRLQSNPLSSLFMKDGVRFIMNFNPNEVVIHDYYQASTTYELEETVENESSDLFYDVTGTFKGSDHRYHKYECQITEIAQYSLRSSSDSVMSDLDEFNKELPDSGSLSELIEGQSE